jgi:hypothetical protein
MLGFPSETAAANCFLVMNREMWLTTIFLCLFFNVQKSKFDCEMGGFIALSYIIQLALGPYDLFREP